MAISNHPLSNAALGAFIRHQHMGKFTVFIYENGNVKLNVPDSSKFVWNTTINEPNEERHKTAPLFTFSDKALDKIAIDIADPDREDAFYP